MFELDVGVLMIEWIHVPMLLTMLYSFRFDFIDFMKMVINLLS